MNSSITEKKWVIVLGAQKCGTTTIADLLSRQPSVFVPSIKETYFFCENSRYVKGFEWWLNEFYSSSGARSADYLCDATPFYLASKEAVQRIKLTLGANVRFIVCLRDPVSRAYSAYWHQRRLGNESLAFEDALKIEKNRIDEATAADQRWWRHAYFHLGCYGEQLENAFDVFGKEKFFILTERDLSSKENIEREIRSFLELSDDAVYITPAKSNSSSMPKSRLLQNLINKDNPLKRLLSFLIPRETRTKLAKYILRFNQKNFKYPPMNVDTSRSLREKYFGDFRRLEEIGIVVPESWKG